MKIKEIELKKDNKSPVFAFPKYLDFCSSAYGWVGGGETMS